MREVVDRALLLSGAPGALEPTSGGIAPSQMLGDFVEAALRVLFESTAEGAPIDQWLAEALDVDLQQVSDAAPMALARLLNISAQNPEVGFSVPPMSSDEDREDLASSREAQEEFGRVSDDLPKETP
jgi:hypothetical protein